MEPTEHVLTFEVELGHSKFEMKDAFDLRTEAIRVGKASNELWDKLSDNHRDVLTKIVRRGLEVFHGNVERFLPNVLTGDQGDFIDINMKVLLSKVEERVEIIEQASDFEQQAVIREMLAVISDELPELTDDEFVDHVRESLENGVNVPNSAVERMLELYDAK